MSYEPDIEGLRQSSWKSFSHLPGMYRLSYGRRIYSAPEEEEDGRLKLAVVHSCKKLPEGRGQPA